jgi:hypothetical protein
LISSPDYVPHRPHAPTRRMTGVPARKPSSSPAQISVSLCLLGTLLFSLNAWGSSGVVAAIEKKYVVTEVSASHEQITKDGTTMSLKCAGIYSLPTNEMMSTPDNTVSDGKIKAPNMMVKYTLEKFGAHVLQTGDKVYITKIEDKTDSKGDVLKFSLLTADSLDVLGQDAKKKFSATVSFRFKKGYLDETPPEDVEQAIEAVMAPDSGSDQAQSGSNPNSGGAAPQARQPYPPQQAAAPPRNLLLPRPPAHRPPLRSASPRARYCKPWACPSR